ncbi:MAG: DUF6335 family protein [Cyanobacteriota bacterium]|nr:DUF6335 family protein [Cyanobacteriota bacterium]
MNQSTPESQPLTHSEEFAQTQPLVDPQEKQQGLDLNDTRHLTDLVGVDKSELKDKDMKEVMEQRDQDRWQLDPDSAENY